MNSKIYGPLLAAFILTTTASVWSFDADAQVAISDSDSSAKALAAPYQKLELNTIAPAAPGNVTIRQTPDVIMNAAPATAPCRIAVGGGFSIVYGGLGANGSVEDKPCNLREAARVIYNCQQNMACIALTCASADYVHAAIPKLCDAARKEMGLTMAEPAKTAQMKATPVMAVRAPMTNDNVVNSPK